MNDEARARLDALRQVLSLLPSDDDRPSPAEVIALAEWVADGSISTATAIEGQKAALYSQHVREEGQ
jgi:hypothetical protein